jgi:hypothetical protein
MSGIVEKVLQELLLRSSNSSSHEEDREDGWVDWRVERSRGFCYRFGE